MCRSFRCVSFFLCAAIASTASGQTTPPAGGSGGGGGSPPTPSVAPGTTAAGPSAASPSGPTTPPEPIIVIPPGSGRDETQTLLVIVQLVTKELRVVQSQSTNLLKQAQVCDASSEEQRLLLEKWALKRARTVQLETLLGAAEEELAKVAKVDDIIDSAVAKISKSWSAD